MSFVERFILSIVPRKFTTGTNIRLRSFGPFSETTGITTTIAYWRINM